MQSLCWQIYCRHCGVARGVLVGSKNRITEFVIIVYKYMRITPILGNSWPRHWFLGILFSTAAHIVRDTATLYYIMLVMALRARSYILGAIIELEPSIKHVLFNGILINARPYRLSEENVYAILCVVWSHLEFCENAATIL